MTDADIPQSALNDAKRLKQYFPYRMIFIIYYPETDTFEASSHSDRRYVNKMMRKGATAWQVV